MTWIKICGITNLEDAQASVEAGTDALGFVFHEKSPRKIDADAARRIVQELPGKVEKIGVFVNDSSERIRDIVERAELSVVQLHGTESAQFARSLFEGFQGRIEIIRVVSMADIPPGRELESGFDPVAAGILTADDVQALATRMQDAAIWSGLPETPAASIRAGAIQRVILDSGSPGEGGTGKAFDWRAHRLFAEAMSTFTNVIIAGGLTPTNVSHLIGILHPWGVDVASGVERAPGRKDPEKLRAFVKAVREAERNP